LPEPDFHRLDTQHYGLRAEAAGAGENVEKNRIQVLAKCRKP
jgi:hypothetical protein